MTLREWRHPHGPLPAYDDRYMSGRGGDRAHYVEYGPHFSKYGSRHGPACRNAVVNFEVDTGDVVTCKTCLRLTTVKTRVGLLVLSRPG